MYKTAKQKDDGRYAYLGMLCQCATYFNINAHSECAKYIVETYLECINNYTFFEWIRGGNPSEKVIVMDKKFLKEHFSDLLSYSDDLEVLQDLFMYLYDQEVWIDRNEKVLFSTVFNLSLKNRTKFNYIGIFMEYERLCVLKDRQIINWEDITSFIECLNYYGYDIQQDYDFYRKDNIYATADNIIERMQQIFPQLG